MNDGEWVTDTPVYGVPCPTATYGVYYFDTVGSNTYNGAPTFEQSPSNTGSFGVDHNIGFNVKPGDHIVISCWIKTAGSDAGLSWGGARIGFDLRTNENGYLQQVCGVNNLWAAENGGDAANAHNLDPDSYVPYGSGWTLLTWNFIVPATYTSDGGYYIGGNAPIPAGQTAVPGEIAPWVQVLDSNYWSTGQIAYSAWFSDYQLSIIGP